MRKKKISKKDYSNLFFVLKDILIFKKFEINRKELDDYLKQIE